MFSCMKKIEAIIRREKLGAVRRALEGVGYPGMTITEVKGHGRQKGKTGTETIEKHRSEFLPKLKLEIIVKDEEAGPIMEAIAGKARTGAIGDGKLFLSSIEDALRVRTGEKGESAI